KAKSLGGHNLSGAVVNPVAFRELFPELKDEDFPFTTPVTKDSVYMMTEKGKFKLPTPPTMHNKGNYVASICEVVRWLGKKAEDAGVNVLTSFPADSLLVSGNTVQGVRTTAAGLNREKQPGGQYMPPTDLRARVTVMSEGTRGVLTQAYLEWQGMEPKTPQIYALGVKELWRTKKVPEGVIHTMGWPLPTDAFGGSFIYPMGKDLVSLGLVVGLDYKKTNVDVHEMLQKLKAHPLLQEYLAGGELVEWGAKTIPEGGWNALPPRLHGDGLLILGDAAGFVNVPALKGIHYAMTSGMLAARAIFKALKANDTSATQLRMYDESIQNSIIARDLKPVRNMRQAFKDGFYVGGVKAALMTLTKGAFPGISGHVLSDAAEPKRIHELDFVNTSSPNRVSKVDGVYLSGNKTRDDIPSHLTVGKDIPPEVAKMYVSMCPAGVYELQGDKLVVNAPNCVDCKATDVIGPRWQPREGGSGPDYKQM
ncbi:MAG: electron-transfer flavoprotein:ubiquinone oxidoreductase, partial [Bdellovibrionia bacterium]